MRRMESTQDLKNRALNGRGSECDQHFMISIIVPVYNVEPYLRQCLDSIVGQTYQDLEILIVDDGSTDGSGNICDEYREKDDRIKVFHTDNRGLSAARNLGLDEATGEYIGFVDSDDWIELDLYEMLLKGIEDADIAVCGYSWEGTSTRNKPYIIDSLITYNTREALVALINEKINTNVWNKIYRTFLFQSIRFPEGHNYEDAETICFITALAGKTILIPKMAYHRRFREDSITSTHTANNLIDCAEMNILRYYYFKNKKFDIYCEQKNQLMNSCAESIIYTWRWWYNVNDEEKRQLEVQIERLKQFSRNELSLIIYSGLSVKKWTALLLTRHSNKLTFSIMHFLNDIYIKHFKDD